MLFGVPLHWIHGLPEPKDAATALWTLGQVPPAERLPILALSSEVPPRAQETLRNIAARGTWDEQDREALQTVYQCKEEKSPPATELTDILEWWARAEEFGTRYLTALRDYQEAFFAEEEKRIRLALQEALIQAQNLAEQLTLPDLLEELTQGLRFTQLPALAELVLAPSYWCTPLLFLGHASAERGIWLFGARPPDASLEPGQAVPDAMARALKALSDPTRLRILRYLSAEPLTPAQLARRLRLRAPTVTHHLRTLRLAGLVQLTLDKGKKERYATRSEAVAATFDSLKGFLEKDSGESPEDANR